MTHNLCGIQVVVFLLKGLGLFYPAQHDSITYGEQDVVHTWVVGDKAVEVLYYACFTLAAQAATFCLGAVEHTAVP